MRCWFEEVWINNRKEAIDEMLANDFLNHGLGEADGTPFKELKDINFLPDAD